MPVGKRSRLVATRRPHWPKLAAKRLLLAAAGFGRLARRRSWLSRSVLPLFFVLLVSLLAHSFNFLNFPIFDDDEGTYVRQAWSVLRLGSLDNYIYGYGHAPVGWLQLAGWVVLTGGFWTFGSPLESGRILILLFHLASTFFLYGIALKISGRRDVAVIAGFIFATAPLAVAYQRRVNLDNMMVFWLLASFYLLLYNKDHLGRIVLSALAFAVGLLVKETGIFFLPAYLYLLFVTTHPAQRRMGIPLWLSVSAGVVSTYILYAALKGELFPAGTLLGGSGKHVSLIEAYVWQSTRPGQGSALEPTSMFWQVVGEVWVREEPFLFLAGAVGTVATIAATVKNRLYLAVGLAPVLFLLYIARGGIVFDFYVIAVIPFLALAISFLLGLVLDGVGSMFGLFRRPSWSFCRGGLTVMAVLGLMVYYLSLPITTEVFAANRTAEQRKALQWIADNLPADTRIAIDGYAWAELHEGRPEWDGKTFPNAHYYWPLAMDADLREETGIRTWRDIEYLLTTRIMVLDLEREQLNPVLEAYRRADLVAKFDEVEIWKVRNRGTGQLEGART